MPITRLGQYVVKRGQYLYNIVLKDSVNESLDLMFSTVSYTS